MSIAMSLIPPIALEFSATTIIITGMTRQNKTTVVGSSAEVDADSLQILAEAEQRFRGQVPEHPSKHARQTSHWFANKPAERGGPVGPEPTRYGDWERNGRCYDF